MRPVSDQFLRILRGSHSAVFEARVCLPGQTGTDPDGEVLFYETGDVQLDASADVFADLSMISDPSRWPQQVTDLVTPYGNEIWCARGVRTSGGASEIVSQGYFRLDKVSQDSAPVGKIALTASDRMAAIIEARLLAPVQFTGAETLESVFERLVLEVLPDAEMELDSDFASDTIGRGAIAEVDRYKFLRDLVRSRGKIMYFDYRGILVVTTPPDPTVPVFEVNEGQDGVLVNLKRELNREGVYNSVVAIGEAPDDGQPVRSVAFDLNPVSPTYWFGTFGKVPRFFQSDLMTTQEHVNDAASAMLARSLGLPYNLGFGSIPNSALIPFDPVLVTVRDRSSIHIIERMNMPLQAEEAMTADTREQLSEIFGVDEEAGA